jgi:hypothetical protein
MAVHDRVRGLTQSGTTVGSRGARRVEANWLTRRGMSGAALSARGIREGAT